MREGGRIAVQPEQQWKGQTDRETQITPSCEERGELTPPPLDLDGEVEMAGEGEGRGEDNPNSGPVDIEEPPPLTPTPENMITTPENEIDMREEGGKGEKRELTECVEFPGNGKSRRREGIKRSLRDIAPVSYEEYEESWDFEDPSKKCRRGVNCLLASCECRPEVEPIRRERGDVPVPVQITGDTGPSGRASTRYPDRDSRSQANKNTGRYSDLAERERATHTGVDSLHIPSSTLQLYSRPRRRQSSWSKKIFQHMLTLLLLLTSVWKVDGNLSAECQESALRIRSLDCNTPSMINKLQSPEFCSTPDKKLENVDKNYLLLMRWKPGLFTCRKGSIIDDKTCKMFQVPTAEVPIPLSGVPVLEKWNSKYLTPKTCSAELSLIEDNR